MRRSISDDELLEWIADGSLVVALDNPKTVLNNGRSVKSFATSSDQKRISFSMKRDGRRRTIVRSRLVYLAGSGAPIPDGFEVHHVDENRYNDAWENLIALSSEDHKKIHLLSSLKASEDFANGF